MSTERKIVHCPFCKSQYRVPKEFVNKMASCKSCGGAFKISFDQEEPLAPVTTAPPGPISDSPASQPSPPAPAPGSEDPDLVLGKFAVKFGLLNEDQLKKLMARYRERGGAAGKVTLSQLILEQKWMTEDQLDYLLKVRQMWTTRNLDKKFGEMVVGRDWATQEDVADALKEQARMFTGSKTIFPIGELLIQGGVISEEQRSAILKIQDRLSELPEYQGAERVDLDSTSGVPLSDDALELTVSPDRLEAFLKVVVPPPDGLNPKQIREYLEKNGIKFGIFDPSRLAALIQKLDEDDRPFKVAQGLAPEPALDQRIEYFFNTDPFCIGTIKEGGEIDFRDRGEIPQVAKDDLLAKKIPGKDGVPGTDVFGRVIPSPKPRSVQLAAGRGVRIAEGGTKAFAMLDGRPELGSDKRLVVYPEYHLNGDVGFKTGHVEFDGHIKINGSIRDGFRVSGGSLVVEEIQTAEIDVDGDIVVLGGVIGADIRAGGSFRAKYVSGATVDAKGDIVVENEIRHSKLEAHGALVARTGKVLGSSLYANKVIDAHQVGTDRGSPTVLTIGLDVALEREIERLKGQIQEKDQLQKDLMVVVEALKAEPDKFHRRMKELAEAWEVAVEKKWALIRTAQAGMDSGKVDEKVLLALKKMDKLLQQTQKYLEAVADEHEASVENIVIHQNEIGVLEGEIIEMHNEIEKLTSHIEERDRPFVRVRGVIEEGTVVKGRFSNHVMENTVMDVVIREVRERTGDNSFRWSMQVRSR